MVMRMLVFVLFLSFLALVGWKTIGIVFKFKAQKIRRWRMYFFIADCIVTVFMVYWYLAFVANDSIFVSIQYRNYILLMGVFLIWFFPRFILAIFLVVAYLFQLLASLLKKDYKTIKQRIVFIGLFMAFFIWGLIIYGIAFGKHNYEIEHVKIEFENLPKAFDGFRIAQISDLHLGSYRKPGNAIKGLELLKKQDFDLLVLTGDIVNNHYSEFLPYIEAFSSIKPKYGCYACLGNHDMGDYRKWYSSEKTDPGLDSLEVLLKHAGISLLRNQSVFLVQNEDSILLAGVDNWGLPPFRARGDVNKAISGKDYKYFTVLLSHDPSHWAAQILPHHDVELTFAGHTHGMQMGIEMGSYSWSPASMLYKHSKGLYFEKGFAIYVNPGYGFIGFPGRIGMNPEITIIELKKAL